MEAYHLKFCNGPQVVRGSRAWETMLVECKSVKKKLCLNFGCTTTNVDRTYSGFFEVTGNINRRGNTEKYRSKFSLLIFI